MKKYQYYIDIRGEVLPTPRGTTTAVETSKYSGMLIECAVYRRAEKLLMFAD